VPSAGRSRTNDFKRRPRGAVILVPSETGEWSESLKPFLYRLKTPDTTVRDVIRKELNDEDNKGKVVEEFLQAAPSDDPVIGAFYGNYTLDSLAFSCYVLSMKVRDWS
jgi:hypothetical protein